MNLWSTTTSNFDGLVHIHPDGGCVAPVLYSAVYIVVHILGVETCLLNTATITVMHFKSLY